MKTPLADLLTGWLPTDCRVCRRWGPQALCAACVDRFSAPTLRCSRCGLAMPGAAGADWRVQTGHAARGQDGAAAAASEPHLAHSLACTHCLDQPPVWRRSVCAEDYAFPWNILIGDFKFRADVALAGLLARRLATVIQGMGAHTDVDLVLPVPLSAARLQQRGFNQAWELARRVARHVGLPAEAQLLQRPIETLHQVELSVKERALNLRGAFMVDPNARARLADRRVALVDDVMTTGATCREAARALLQAGASCVDVWAVARTP